MQVAEQILEESATETHGRPGRLSAWVVDSSCFTLPYDYSLCEALMHCGCATTLVRSEFQNEPWPGPTSFQLWNHFYKRSANRARSRGPMWKMGKLYEHASGMSELVAECGRRKPDVIHFQWLPVPVVDAPYLSRLRRMVPLFLTLHNTSAFHGSLLQRAHQGLGLSLVFKHLDGLIVHTEFSRNIVLEHKWMPAEKIHVVPHGVLDYYRSVQPASVPTKSDEPIALFFGVIERYKGVDLLIRAFAALPDDIRSTSRLVIAGRPTNMGTELRKLACLLGVEHRITWISRFIDEREIPELFSSASVVVLPYREIDQSGVLMTAIAFDKPVIASAIGGFAETLHDGVQGRLFPAGDVPALANALADVLRAPERRRGMEGEMRKLRQNFSWENSARCTMEIYARALSNR